MSKPTILPNDYTAAEAAEAHGSTRQAIYHAIRAGKIDGAYKRGSQWFVPRTSLRKWERASSPWRDAYERGRVAVEGDGNG